LKDAACGTKAITEDWCDKYAPMAVSSSNVYCEDFDTDEPLSGNYGYSNAVARSNWVGGDYISPYCAFKAEGSDPTGAYSFHAYTYAEPAGTVEMSADLMVPNVPACNGATVLRIWASPSDDGANSVSAWVKVSGLQGSGATPSSYDAELYVVAGTRPDGGTGGGPVTGPAKVTVTPGAGGWARLNVTATSYSIPPAPMNGMAQDKITAVVSWAAAGVVKATAAHTSTPLSTMGDVLYGAATPGAEGDVGIIPDPATGAAVTGCAVLVDDAVSNITP
jgi:hypothetical protein